MSLRAVIFDFGGVLCFPPGEPQFAPAADVLGLSTQQFIEAFWQDRIAYDCGQDAAVYWRRIAQLAGNELTPDLLTTLLQHEIALWRHFDERMLTWAHTLQRAGLRTSILSNLPRSIGEGLRATPGFLEHFDQITFSYELGFVKPDRRIYDYALQGLGVTANEALFLDDRPENIHGARAVGLHAHLFTTWEEFLKHGRGHHGLPEPEA